MIVFRWLAMAIAAFAIWDPSLRMARVQGPPVDLIVSTAPARAAAASAVADRLQRELKDAGFRVNTGSSPAARVLIADRPPSGLSAEIRTWGIDMTSSSREPNVLVRTASASPTRISDQSVEIRAVIQAHGVTGQTTEVRLEQSGVVLASARHAWAASEESWTTSLYYLPPSDEASDVTVRAVPLDRETTIDDNAFDLRLPPPQRPIRVLSYDASVAWPAVFVRRSLEGEPGIALATLQRASQGVATRAGAPPDVLSASTLAPFDIVVVGGPEGLTQRDVEALRWFVEERGGVVAFIPVRRPSGPYARLLGVKEFDERVLEDPVTLDAAEGITLRSGELIVAKQLPLAARPLATVGHAPEAVVFSIRRGAGGIVFSGALDAWRYRAADQQAFARFWRRTVIEAAQGVPPRLGLEIEPALARVGEKVHLRARVRSTELRGGLDAVSSEPISARAIAPARHIDDPIRLWPTREPGTFEGDWTIPAAGEYVISVSSGDAVADASVAAVDAVARGADDDVEGLEMLTRASGGEMRAASETPQVVDAMTRALRRPSTSRQVHPMRSPWWMAAFAVALCGEWGWRRARGGR